MITYNNQDKVEFTPEMKKTHTILAPMMLPIHLDLVASILNQYGYKVEVLKTTHQGIIDEGLKNVHNDICYPALLVIGQMMDALKSGKYDPDKTALMITQTGGGCRASNYLYLLRKALKSNGFGQVPVISVNLSNFEKNGGFQLTLPILIKASFALLYGDLMLCISNQCKPYEIHKGDTQKVMDQWSERLCQQFSNGGYMNVKQNYRAMLEDFAKIPRKVTAKVKVGIVGEIYMKYSPLGNNSLEEFLISEGAEPVVSGVMDFMLYCFANQGIDKKLYGKKSKAASALKAVISYIVSRQKQMIRAIKEQGIFTPPTEFSEVEKAAEGFIGKGVKMGEGWLLTAEMLELIHSGVNNVVCTQPFGCMPNHIVAKGMMRKIKDAYPNSNIVAIDYDPSATKINQENRLKLMLANARILAEQQGANYQYVPDKKAVAKEIYVS